MDSEKHGPRRERSIAIVAVTRHGVNLAFQIQSKLPGSVCHVPLRHRFALAMGAVGFHRMKDLLAEIWSRYDAFVCIMATGIVVRQIAPFLQHKTVDPAVVVLDEQGRYVISLVSGHLGGANRLARQVARFTGGQAVITTATDVQSKPALDLIAQEAGLELENIEMLGRVTRAVLEDEPLWVYDPEGRLRPYLKDQKNIRWVMDDNVSTGEVDRLASQWGDLLPSAVAAEKSAGEEASAGVWVSESLVPEGIRCLVLRPKNLVVGIGCNRGTPSHEILELLESVFLQERFSLLSIKNLASVDLKSDESGLLEAGQVLKRPVFFYRRSEIENIAVPNPSLQVEKHIGVQSVCEATALLSAQSQTLIVPKQKTANVTLAVARADSLS